ncbi:hypothetical protein Dimus_019469 [Dionaea muscipula]
MIRTTIEYYYSTLMAMASLSLSFHHLLRGGLAVLSDIQPVEFLLALIVFISIHSLRQKRTRGLAVWPVVGMIPSLILALRGDVYEWASEIICRQKGTFIFNGPRFSNINCVVTADPRNLEHMLKTKFLNYPKGEYFRILVNDLLGDGIFSADDGVWMRQRKTASHEFHSAKFRQLTVDSLLELVHHRLIPTLEDSIEKAAAAADPHIIDLQDVLLRLTFDNVCMLAFGVDPGCLRPGLPEIPVAHAFEEATEATVLRFVTPTSMWRAMRYLNLGSERRLKKSIREVDEFANGVIRRRKKEIKLEKDDGVQATRSKRSDLLTVFMGLRDEEGKPFSDKFLRDICVNFILAGRDTSSVALSWFFWLIDKHPAVEEKILAEICGIISERPATGDGDATTNLMGSDDHGDHEVVFQAEEVKRMEYLHAAISEALRLYPSVPVDYKQAVEDDVFPDGLAVKKGTRVLYAIFTMGRMEAIWGKDCREYKPERWLRDGRFISESAYKFTAFNGGPRFCLGKDFAYYQMKFAASAIIYRYRVNVVRDHPVIPRLALTMYMKYGLKVNLIRRNQIQLHNKLS